MQKGIESLVSSLLGNLGKFFFLLLVFDKMDFLLELNYFPSQNCFCHVYQMQINWDFFYTHIDFFSSDNSKKKQKKIKFLRETNKGENYGTRGQRWERISEQKLSIPKIPSSWVVGRRFEDVMKLISINSHENRLWFPEEFSLKVANSLKYLSLRNYRKFNLIVNYQGLDEKRWVSSLIHH